MTLGICGLGLMGSSAARGLIDDHTILGLDPDPDAAAGARRLGVTMVDSLSDMADCEVILLAAPTAVNAALLTHLMTTGPRVPTADLGSVKGPIIGLWSTDRSFPFVATHPMAGSERSGVTAGAADLFRGSAWPVVVDADTDPGALVGVIRLILALGAHVVPVSAPVHDQIVAAVSHLPHLLAGALGDVVANVPQRELAVSVAAGSFRDGSRVSASPPQRTAEFIATNRDAAAAARQAAARLEAAATAIENGDRAALAQWLAPGAEVRVEFEARDSGSVSDITVASAADVRDLLHAHRDSGWAVLAITESAVTVREGRA